MTDLDESTIGQTARAELAQTEAAFARLRQEMLEMIAASAVIDQVRREKLYFGVQIVDAVKTSLLRAVDAGEAADMRLIVNSEILKD